MSGCNWQDYMAKQDMVWNSLPTCWEEGAFIGNGFLGSMIYEDKGDMLFKIGRTDVHDQRVRMQIGELRLIVPGKITKGTGRLDLWNGTVNFNLNVEGQELKVSSYVSSEPNIIVVEIKGESETGTGFQPDFAMTPRIFIPWTKMLVPYKNPNPVVSKKWGIDYCYQELNCGYHYVTGYKTVDVDDQTKRIYITVAYGKIEEDIFLELNDELQKAADMDISENKRANQEYWHNFYKKSYMILPDKMLESFYWIQLYKLASGTREDRLPLDLMGPWTDLSAWPKMWWNLNAQLTYWPLLASNHLELAEPLRKLFKRHDQLAENVPEIYMDDETLALTRSTPNNCLEGGYKVSDERCNLMWMCHSFWLMYRHTMDKGMLRDEIYPLLRGALNFYIKQLVEVDGVLHTPVGISPEYKPATEDCNIDLALVRWGCETLLEICHILSVEDQLMDKWKYVLDHLVEYQIRDNILMIGKDVAYEKSHRHYSHLFPIYPLYLMNYEQEENRSLMEDSIHHWVSMSEAFRGYSFTGAASMFAAIRDGNKAYEFLNKFVKDVSLEKHYILPNTMYKEGSPVIETPLSAVKTLQEMLLQSWGDRIAIFPAIPDEWKDIEINNMLAEGAFSISAKLVDGQLAHVKIVSLRGGLLKLENSFTSKEVLLNHNNVSTLVEGDIISIDTKEGDVIVLEAQGIPSNKCQAPVEEERHYWGKI